MDSEEKKRAFIGTLMHEFGHVIEEHFDLNFNEEWIEKIVDSYKPIQHK